MWRHIQSFFVAIRALTPPWRKATSYLPEDPVERRLFISADRVKISRSAIPVVKAQNNYEFVARNCSSAVKDLLVQIALTHRAKRDAIAVRAAIAQIVEFVDCADDAIYKSNESPVTDTNFIYVANLAWLFRGAMLAGEWGRAAHLAASSRLSVVIDGTGGVEPAYSRMLAAVLNEDEESFAASRERYLSDIGNSDFAPVYEAQTYFRHDKLLASILKCDAPAFEKLLVEFEQLFLARASDPKFECEGFLDGGTPEENRQIFDVESTALACLAVHRGMSIQFNSEIIPLYTFAGMPNTSIQSGREKRAVD